MRINEYEELRSVHEAIGQVNSGAEETYIKEKESRLSETLKRVVDLAKLVRQEGLLALEEAIENIEITSPDGFLKQLILLVVDGTDPTDVRKIGWSRYYASQVQDYMALTYLIYIEGALAIQARDMPRIIEEQLKAMLPNSLYYEYCLEQQREVEEVMQKASENIIEKLCTGKRLWNPKDSGYFVMKLADYVLRDIRDGDLERLLRKVSNAELALAMKGLGGEARKHIFSNLSDRLGKMIAEDMEHMGPVRAVDVVYATQTIIVTLLRMIDGGEIADNYKYLAPFYEVFCVDEEKEQQKISKFYELERLIKEYEEMEKNKME